MRPKKFDFVGWATKNDLRCSDGRTIRKNAFKDDDGREVPLVWQHQHNDPTNVLGHALLENCEDGVRAYCTFNHTDNGQYAKELVEHKDITSLSIYANKLTQKGGDVLHGSIREVSLVLAGANPGALIDFTSIQHSDGSIDIDDSEAVIYNGDTNLLMHSDDEKTENTEKEDKTVQKGKTISDVLNTLTKEQKDVMAFLVGMAVSKLDPEDVAEQLQSNGNVQHSDESSGKTIKEVYDSMTEEQRIAVNWVINQAMENAGDEDEDEGESTEMKHNVFEQDDEYEAVISHSDMQTVLENAKRVGSFKSALEDYAENTLNHSIDDIEMLFPDAKNVTEGAPAFVKRDDAWVTTVFNGVHKTPFSRV